MRTCIDITLYLATHCDSGNLDVSCHLATRTDLDLRLQVFTYQIASDYTINYQLSREQKPTFDFEVFCHKGD